MRTELIHGEAIVGKHVAFTMVEIRQISEVLNKVEKVIESHNDDKAKNLYLSDDDLYRLEAIFMCILESESDYATTCFDKYEESMRKMRQEKSQESI